MARIQSADGLRVDGIVELSKALKEISPELRKELRLANKSVAQFVADDSRAAAYSLGGVAALVAPSIKASAGQAFAGVSFGGSEYPMAGGAEFGSIRYPQFQPWRGNSSDAGYFVYPSIRHDSDRIATEYTAAMDTLLRKAGLI